MVRREYGSSILVPRKKERISVEREFELFGEIELARREVVDYLAEQQPVLILRYCQFLDSVRPPNVSNHEKFQDLQERLRDTYQTIDFSQSACDLFQYASQQKWNKLGWGGLREVIRYWRKEAEVKIKSADSAEERSKLEEQLKQVNELEGRWEKSLSDFCGEYLDPLVALVRKKYWLDQDTVFTEGYFGLFDAADKFNPKMGVRFITYAHRWIRVRMKREVEAVKDRLNPLSFETPIGEDGDGTLEDFIADEKSVDGRVVEEENFKTEIRNMLIESNQQFKETDDQVRFLTNQEFEIISLHYGLPDESGDYREPMKLELVGERYDISKQVAHKRIKKGLRKLRNSRFRELFEAL